MRFKARIHDPLKQWKLSQRTLRERREGYRRSPTPADLMVPEIY